MSQSCEEYTSLPLSEPTFPNFNPLSQQEYGTRLDKALYTRSRRSGWQSISSNIVPRLTGYWFQPSGPKSEKTFRRIPSFFLTGIRNHKTGEVGDRTGILCSSPEKDPSWPATESWWRYIQTESKVGKVLRTYFWNWLKFSTFLASLFTAVYYKVVIIQGELEKNIIRNCLVLKRFISYT